MAIQINKILLAAKNKKSCEGAAKLAGQISTAFKSKLIALVSDEIKNDIKFNTLVSDITFEPLNKDVQNQKQIKEVCNKHNPDMIILPVSNGNEEAIVNGKEANSIIDHLERMVLTFPAGVKEYDMLKIVVPIDTSFETRQKVPYAEAFARHFGSTIHIIGVSNDKGKDAEVTLNNYIRQVYSIINDHGFKCEVENELHMGINPTEKTIEFANKIKAGLIIIMTEQESNLISFFSGKYSEQMVKKSNIPVLSIHPKDLVVSEARL